MGSIAADVHEIPVIDFSNKELKPGSHVWSYTCDQIRYALEEYGCFVAKYDELLSNINEDDTQIFCQSKELFDLPTETKMKNISEEPFRGYLGKNPQVPLYEGLAIDRATSLEEVRKFVDLMWINGNHHFCDIVHSYAKQIASLDEMATKMVFESYGVEKHWKPVEAVRSHVLRFLKYDEPKQDSDTTIRFVPHTDKNFTTILHQTEVGGLQVQAKDGTWISVHPKPSHFLLMAGDMMKVWSNDRIRACYHQVSLSGHGERYSMGMFTFTDGEIKVPEEFVDDEHPILYKPFDNRKYIRFYVTDEAKKTKDPIKAFCGV
ncbi:probable 2-oxoglutarate-dependent dioxygenase AOP1 [Humulus lupulus]|uniref:probable 2-oxoglutarate-dependent dioxygenase AOP1 n=1 Tax=Humulus lupulus TaxID=3486 RepID=UPI002B4176A0|nr:probable 2-oxoglutarate-dependent dioxygenase AOP1 [Humulus lupulus]